MKFPARQSDIAQMAEIMVKGYFGHVGDFPSVSRMKLLAETKKFKNAVKNQIESRSAMANAVKNKNEKLDILTNLMKSCIKKSLVDTRGNPAKLALIGWGPKARSQPSEAPSQPNNLTAITSGPKSLSLMWDKPKNNSPLVRNYIIERRSQLQNGQFGPWQLAATAYQTQINLTNQPHGVQLEYRVKAVNGSGASNPSNSASVSL